MLNLSRFKKNIAYLFVVYIFIFSSVAALLSTTVQLFFEYKRDIGHIETTLAQIKKSHVETIVSSLWTYDTSMLEIQLQGVRNLPDVVYVSVRKNDRVIMDSGAETPGSHLRSYEFPLQYSHRGQAFQLGTLTVDVSLSGVYRRLYDRVLIILATQSLNTFLVSIFIFFLFYFIVGRHLTTMAAFARRFNLKNLDTPLALKRRAGSGRDLDELGLVESAINTMRRNLIDEMDTVRTSREALEKSEERFRSLVANIPGIVYRCEPSPPWRVDYISDQVERVTGYPAHDFLAGNIDLERIVHPEDISKTADKVSVHVAGGNPFEIEYRILHKEGGIRWLLETGKAVYGRGGEPLWLDGMMLDVTEKKQTEQQLNEKDLLLQSIIENTTDAVFFKDLAGRYVLANTAALKAIGQPESAVIGRTDAELFPRESAEIINQTDSRIIASGEALISEERLQTSYGDTYWQANKSPLLDYEGAIVGLVGISRNITDVKLAQRQNEELEKKLLQSQKMESIGRLAGGVAHDFNNMLSIILGNAEIILEDMDPASPLITNLKELHTAAERSANLTRQLLAFARKQTIDPRRLNLNDVVTDMLKMLQRLIGEDIALEWLPADGLWPVKIDPSQTDQILANLCINSRDAIAGVGKITIETANVSLDHAHIREIADGSPGDYVMIVIRDTGTGMDKETLENLFEPFFTTKDIGQGSGLGLATVYGIVKQNHGFISVTSDMGMGTTFRIYFPRDTEAVLPAQTGDAGETDAMTGHETILVVEDEKAILRMTAMMLERLGYRVLCASTPSEAIRIMENRPCEIHLLMTDVIMPQMNGRALSEIVMQDCPKLKCLFMSGYTADVIAHHGVLDGGVAFINKPFSKQALAARVREILDRPVHPV